MKVQWEELSLHATLQERFYGEYIELQKDHQRPRLHAVMNEAFYHGTKVQDVIRGAGTSFSLMNLICKVLLIGTELLLPTVTEWIYQGLPKPEFIKRLKAVVSGKDAHLIASSLIFWRAYTTVPESHRWMTGALIGRLGRSQMVDDGEGVLYKWRRATPSAPGEVGRATAPIIDSLVRDRLIKPVNIRSVVEGLSMLPNDVISFFELS